MKNKKDKIMRDEIIMILSGYPNLDSSDIHLITEEILSLLGENETGVSDDVTKYGVLHDVMKSNANDKPENIDSSLVDCGYEKITDDGKDCHYCEPARGFYHGMTCQHCKRPMRQGKVLKSS